MNCLLVTVHNVHKKAGINLLKGENAEIITHIRLYTVLRWKDFFFFLHLLLFYMQLII